MAIMAHTEAKISEVYTRAAQRAQLAATGIARLDSLDLEKVDHENTSVVHIANKSQ